MFETGQVLREEMYDVINMLSTLIRQLRSHDLSSVRCVYLVQVAVEDSTVSTVTLSAGLTPGRTWLRLRPHPVRQRGVKKTFDL